MRTSVRWLVPVAAAAMVAGGTVVISAQADSSPSLPAKTPQQVVELVAASSVTAISGTVVTRTDLGLPSLSALGSAAPGGGPSGGVSATDAEGLVTRFLAGQNTLRVWADGPTRQKLQLLDSFDELDVVRNGTDVWTYAAKRDQVGHARLTGDRKTAPSSSVTALTPADAAAKALAAADPTTEVTLGEPRLVASRPTYTLRLVPRTTGTLVGSVQIAVDSATGAPLQVQIFPRGKTQPAVETGFTQVDFSAPPASTFAFTPPAGAKVSELGDGTSARPPASGTPTAKPTVTGTGWASVVELPAPRPPAAGATPGTDDGTGQADALLNRLTTPVSGGRALTSSLLSVLVTDDGRVLAGSVPVDTLVTAARR